MRSWIWTYSGVFVPRDVEKLFLNRIFIRGIAAIYYCYDLGQNSPYLWIQILFQGTKEQTHQFGMRHILGQLYVKRMEDWLCGIKSVCLCFPDPQISFNQSMISSQWWSDDKRNHFLHKSGLNQSKQVNRSNQFKDCIFPLICSSL